MATDDLDRRIREISRQEIVAALRIEADVFKKNGYESAADLRRAVADSLDPPEPELLPCPFCGSKPEYCFDDKGKVGCCNVKCDMEGWHSVEFWNRREVPHG